VVGTATGGTVLTGVAGIVGVGAGVSRGAEAGCWTLVCDGEGATTNGGRTITGPTGGLLAIAGAAGVTIGACGLGCGTTMRRGAAAATGAAATGALAGGAVLAAAGAAALAAGGWTATAAGRCGWLRASASACLRARIAFIASPGFEMWERSKAGLASAAGFATAPPRRFWK
jgi:hypothetical protein